MAVPAECAATSRFPTQPGVAIYDGMVFIGMIDGHIAALDAKTGREIWNRQAVDDPQIGYYSMAPVPYKGKILIGKSNGDRGGIGNVTRSTRRRVTALAMAVDPQTRRARQRHVERRFLEARRRRGVERHGDRCSERHALLNSWKSISRPPWESAAGAKSRYQSMVALDISGSMPKLK